MSSPFAMVSASLLLALSCSSDLETQATVLLPNESCSGQPDAAIATFEDANLEVRVRAALSVGAQDALTCRLVSVLTELDAEESGIESLLGTQNLTGLSFLGLLENSITEISALSGLTSLRSLDLGDNSITDISALSELTSLEFLRLENNSITDISAVSELTSLTELALSHSPISDISTLSGLTRLRNLELHDMAISDISALSGLTNLTVLDLDQNSITDVSPLNGLTSLRALYLDQNSITDVSPLNGLTSLRALYLDDSSITDITPLSGLTGLLYLSLGGNSISDISALSELTSLELLRLDDNSITDISAVSGLTSLRYLNLNRNPGLANIQPLLDNTGLGAGHTVFLSGTNVSCTGVAALMGVYVVGVAPCFATLATSGLAQSTASVPRTTERIQERSYQFEEASQQMEYQLYVPTAYDAATPSPLLVLLHGAGSNPGVIIRYQGLTDLAEERGYIVVAPMGYDLVAGYGAPSGRASELSERDVMNVLELTLEEFNVDRDRVYLSGHSMGGAGTLHLAIKYPDIWAALGPVAPGVPGTSPDALSAITHIPVIMVHGDDDASASVEISRTWVAKMAELGMTHRYIEIPGGDHNRIIARDRDNVEAIFDFFDQARRN